MMTRDYLAALWVEYQTTRTEELRNRLAEHYLPVVTKIADKFSRRLPPDAPLDSSDLIAEGCFGLLESIERFEPERGYKFETFASQRIHGAMADGLRRLDHVSRLERIRQKADPDRFIPERVSIEFLAESCGTSHFDPLADSAALEPERRVCDLDTLRMLTVGLNKSERILLIEYYWLGRTMKEIGHSLGISESRVSQMHSRLLVRIAERLTRDEAPPVEDATQTEVLNPPQDVPRKESPMSASKPSATEVSKSVAEFLDGWTLETVDAEITEHERELASLKILRKIIAAREGKSQSGDGAGKRSESREQKLRKIATFLEAAGPSKAAAIADACQIPRGSITSMLVDARFEKKSDGTYALRA